MAETSPFDQAPKAVTAYFDRRPNVPTFDWRDVAPRDHALAFTVAKTTGFDVIDDLRAAARQAVVDRIPYDQFVANLRPTLEAKGWWGRKPVTDPNTGRDQMAQLGSPRRLQIIYWANTASAHAAGEWDKVQRTKDVLPYLTYLISLSEHKRPLHLSWVGTTLLVDDGWWRKHYPPNGWFCKCRVRQISAPAADRVPEAKRTAPPLDEQPWKNKRTGETEMVPAGVDPGWQHNAGVIEDRSLGKRLADRLDELPVPARREAVAEMQQQPLFDLVQAGKTGPDTTAPIAVLPAPIQKALSSETSILRFSGATAAKELARHPEVASEIYAGLQAALPAATVFVDGPQNVLLFATIDDKLWRAAIKVTADGAEVFLTTLHRSEQRQLQRAQRRLQPIGNEE